MGKSIRRREAWLGGTCECTKYLCFSFRLFLLSALRSALFCGVMSSDAVRAPCACDAMRLIGAGVQRASILRTFVICIPPWRFAFSPSGTLPCAARNIACKRDGRCVLYSSLHSTRSKTHGNSPFSRTETDGQMDRHRKDRLGEKKAGAKSNALHAERDKGHCASLALTLAALHGVGPSRGKWGLSSTFGWWWS